MVTTINNRVLGESRPLTDASWTLYLPASMHELRAEVLEDDWDTSWGTFIFHLGRAGSFRRGALDYIGTNPERAFVALFRAANLLLVKLPTHPDYELVLDDRQRETLSSTGEITFSELGELKKRILERQNKRKASQKAPSVGYHTPKQSMIRIPSLSNTNPDDGGRRKYQEINQNQAQGYPFPPSEVTAANWQTRTPTPNGPRAPAMALPSPRMNSAHNPPPLFPHAADSSRRVTKVDELALPRRRASSAHVPLPLPRSELHRTHSFLSSTQTGTKRPSYSPGPIRRVPSHGRYPLYRSSSANMNPIEFEIKRKMKERRKACHDQTTSDSSGKMDAEAFFSSFTSD